MEQRPPAPSQPAAAPDPATGARRQPQAAPQVTLSAMLGAVAAQDGSDLHLKAGVPVRIRQHGRLRDLTVSQRPVVFQAPELQKMLFEILTTSQQARFEEHHELDFAWTDPAAGRFRTNFSVSFGEVQAAFRHIPAELRTLEELGLPRILARLAAVPRGLVLVTGPTGSGKSTTLAAMIDLINRSRHCHILTIEDPVEYIHPSKSALVSQRELHSDTYSFAAALRAGLRQDPDVILVGELRDAETMALGLEAAETGHTVFATLHTQDASQTVDRIIQTFPAAQQSGVCVQLSQVLEGIVTQQLVPTPDGTGRSAACEILIMDSAARNLVRKNEGPHLHSHMTTQRSSGMQTMEDALAGLVASGKASLEQAVRMASRPEEIQGLVQAKIRDGAGR